MKTESQQSPYPTDIDTSVALPNQLADDLPISPRPRWLEPFNDAAFRLGSILLVVSASLFLLYDRLGNPRQDGGNSLILIMVHYSLALFFSVRLLLKGFLKFNRVNYASGRPVRWLGLLLWLISAYALNREMAVFQQSTAWLCWALVIVGLGMIGYVWKESLSVRWQQVLYAVLAFGWCLFAYMSVYIVGLYPVSIPLLIGLGLSIHTFVPLAFAIALGKRIWQDYRREEHLRFGIISGLSVPIIAIGVFLTGWIQGVNRIETTRQEATIRKTTDLPDWVLIAQNIRPGWIMNRLLLSKRVYDEGRFFEGAGWGLERLTALDDVRQHDPLVVLASQVFPPDFSSETEQLSLIKLLSADQHGTEEKFWTGRHLTTEAVVSQVRIWPQFRLSYTEQTIRIRNQARNTTEEALLTFHLSPGSVVSSMSLWVNGKEESAYLTTTAKADSAYRTIVGVESKVIARDPSVIYWQEGNRVRVRVFPCRAGEDRRVKLGITSPLRLDNTELVYQNPYFEGPNPGAADELVTIDFAAAPTDLKSPWVLSSLSGNTLRHQGNYQPDWSLRFQAPPLSAETFALGNRTYQMEVYHPVLESFQPTDVFLDVNGEWTEEEFKTACQTATQAKARAWVFLDGLQQVTSQNRDGLFEELSQQPFSLFPIYRVSDPATALLITKGTAIAPLLTDLRGSRFADHFGLLAKHTTAIRTFCLNATPSPYVRSLAELQVLTVAHGSVFDLTAMLTQTHLFPQQPNEPGHIVLSDAAVAIREKPTSAGSASTAPDHLARLFSYNHLIRHIGRHYFTKNYQTDTLIQEAQRAHVVSPLSSLVVLETAKDYERFGIKKDFSGLDNATLKEEGAVPEPHEWALLAMVLGLIGWLTWKKRYALP